jgi:hypothetical protein
MTSPETHSNSRPVCSELDGDSIEAHPPSTPQNPTNTTHPFMLVEASPKHLIPLGSCFIDRVNPLKRLSAGSKEKRDTVINKRKVGKQQAFDYIRRFHRTR